jgi:hypothetical protein
MSNHSCLGRLSLLILAAALASTAGAAPASGVRMRLFVPAYFYPGGAGLKGWDGLIDAARKVPVTAIVNPASGPGKAPDPNYTRALDRAAGAGVTLIGYVSTSYAKRPRADVEADVDRWVTFYPAIRGIFFDEQASGPEQVEYYAALSADTRRRIRNGVVITNPGTACDPAYFTRAGVDAVCVWENRGGFERLKQPVLEKASPEQFVALAHGVAGTAAMEQAVRKAASERIGYVYVTDDVLPNPWDRLPVYWKDEVAAVAGANGKG